MRTGQVFESALNWRRPSVQPNILSKADFARQVGVTRSRVSQWIAEGKLDGAALVIVGQSARIDADVARRQLGAHVGGIAGGGNVRGETIEAIQRERLAALQLTNERARVEARATAGGFVEADAMRAEVGRIAGRLISAFDGALPELATSAATVTGGSERDILHALRGSWSAIRARVAGFEAEAATLEPETVEASL